LVDTALDGIERELGVKLERSDIKYLRMPYKGMPAPTVIRKKKEEVRDVIESLQFLSRPCNISMFATPQWLHITCPSSLVGSNF